MADLRITGVSLGHLELEAPDGSKHTLEITEDLLKAMKSRKPVDANAALTPREIQEQIRLGKSIDQLLITNPSDEDAIRKFGAPIVAELNHVVSLARNVRLNLATDRFADPSNIEFGLVMDDRLAANGANNLAWSSKKSTDGQWLVSVSFQIGTEHSFATWSFNAKQLLLTPENQTAIQLSNGMTLNLQKSSNERFIPPAGTEPTTTFIHPVIEQSVIVESPAPLSVVPEIIDPIDTEVLTKVEDTSTRPTLRVIPEEPEPIFSDDYLDEPLDAAIEPEVEIPHSPVVEPVFETEVLEERAPAPEPAKPQTTSRWAEVLFGEKNEDEEF